MFNYAPITWMFCNKTSYAEITKVHKWALRAVFSDLNSSYEVHLQSGQLVDSLAKTLSAGCKPYMAPERINPSKGQFGYDIRSSSEELIFSEASICISCF